MRKASVKAPGRRNGSLNIRWASIRIASIYLVLGSSWILFSDSLLNKVVSDRSTVVMLSMVKGWVYVIVSAWIIYYLVFKNMRKLKKSEEEIIDINSWLEETNARLEEEIAENTRTQEDLIKARDEAERANSAKSVFLANMSHELRNPMNGILGMTELALMTELDSDQKSYLELVKKSALTLHGIINDILDYSVVEAGNLVADSMAFSPSKAISETVALYETGAAQKGLELNVSIDGRIPGIIYGDAPKLKQILSILVGNALKFTSKGFVEISAGLDCEKDGREILSFAVRDTGIGIPANKLGLLFERFQQLDSSYTKQFNGAGLGLAISKKLVELLGGRIWVESREHFGSTFYFTVALKRADGGGQAVGEGADEGAAGRGMRKRVLIVEDDETNRKFIQRLLEKHDFETMAAENGRIAVELHKEKKADLIIMDVQMPELDGLGATRSIRKLESGAAVHTPIIAVTAYALLNDEKMCLDAGMDDYVSKPVDIDTLMSKIKRLLCA